MKNVTIKISNKRIEDFLDSTANKTQTIIEALENMLDAKTSNVKDLISENRKLKAELQFSKEHAREYFELISLHLSGNKIPTGYQDDDTIKKLESETKNLKNDIDYYKQENSVLLNLVKDLKAVIDRNDEMYQSIENDKAEIKEMKQTIKAKLEKLIIQEKPKAQSKPQPIEIEIDEWETI